MMQKLQRPGEGLTAAGAAMPPAASYGTGANALQPLHGSVPQSAAASAPPVKQERTILLRNMFAPEDAKADEDFEEEMKEDITGECAKFGRIEHVKVDKVCMVSVYLGPKFRTSHAAWWFTELWMSECVCAVVLSELHGPCVREI